MVFAGTRPTRRHIHPPLSSIVAASSSSPKSSRRTEGGLPLKKSWTYCRNPNPTNERVRHAYRGWRAASTAGLRWGRPNLGRRLHQKVANARSDVCRNLEIFFVLQLGNH